MKITAQDIFVGSTSGASASTTALYTPLPVKNYAASIPDAGGNGNVFIQVAERTVDTYVKSPKLTYARLDVHIQSENKVYTVDRDDFAALVEGFPAENVLGSVKQAVTWFKNPTNLFG